MVHLGGRLNNAWVCLTIGYASSCGHFSCRQFVWGFKSFGISPPQSPSSAQTPLAGSGYSICRYSRYQKPLDRMRSTLTPVRTRGDCRKGSSGLGGKRDRLAGWYCKPSPAPTVWTCLNDYCRGIGNDIRKYGLGRERKLFLYVSVIKRL